LIAFGLTAERQIAEIDLISSCVLPFWGYFIEQNDPDELILIKKMLGKPYTNFELNPQNRLNFDQSSKKSSCSD
tara:strand:+ start:1361 stop:1582 length:222 start_codon:yes stop_codon:yes gene_type:complete